MLCQRESLPVAEEYAKDPNTLEFTMDYECLPDNVIHRLMVEMRNDLDLDNVWRTGARFVQAGTALSAVVKSEGNLLRIFVRSENLMHPPITYLHIIKGNIDRINADMRLQEPFCKVIYKDGNVRETFDYEDLIAALKDGDTTYRSKKLRRKIPIQDILNQSGRMAEMALNKLRDDIITACRQLQGNRMYWDTDEDNRNTAIRDALRNMGYLVYDQTLQGVGGGKEKRAGELDLEIRQEGNIPWTICEALNISGKENSVWEPHLKKLLDNYNSSGMNYLFLLTYVESDRDTFPDIWNHFREHIRCFNPDKGNYEWLPNSFCEFSLDRHNNPEYIRAAKITYDREGSHTTVCHIFARMGR